MKKGYLSDYFKGIAIKRLSAVEVDLAISHQHEINGISELKNLLGFNREEYSAKFIYLGDDEEENKSEIGYVTWYDARENHPCPF